jgi:hypothetical protein
MSSSVFELRIGLIEKETFTREDFGRVFFLQRNGKLIEVKSENLPQIRNFSIDQVDFDQNLLQWQNWLSGVKDKQYSYQMITYQESIFTNHFWKNDMNFRSGL